MSNAMLCCIQLLRADFPNRRTKMLKTERESQEQVEVENRAKRRIRLARLPAGVEMKNFDLSRRRGINQEQLDKLSDPDWLEQCTNLYIHGHEASGKTFLAAALGKQWCKSAKTILFVDTAIFVNRLDRARNFTRSIKMLDRYDALILDDVSKALRMSRITSKILIPLLEHRKNRHAVIATSDFRSWNWVTSGTEIQQLFELLVNNATIVEMQAQCLLAPRCKRSAQ
jgi:DNA replication protein DnaC